MLIVNRVEAVDTSRWRTDGSIGCCITRNPDCPYCCLFGDPAHWATKDPQKYRAYLESSDHPDCKKALQILDLLEWDDFVRWMRGPKKKT